MSGFVTDLTDRHSGISIASEALHFPWEVPSEMRPLEQAHLCILGEGIEAPMPYPPYTRSLRDGYALRSADVTGASPTSPVYLSFRGEIPMGTFPEKPLLDGEAIAIHTGGILPCGSDGVIMLEDTMESGPWIEVRKAVQKGENVIFQGEEVKEKEKILPLGSQISCRTIGILATMGITTVPCAVLKIGIISTGDEIVDSAIDPLPLGCIRDVNSWALETLLLSKGYMAQRLGIVSDQKDSLRSALYEAFEDFDVVLVSGGSSVSVRDYCSELFQTLPQPGLIVRGLRMSPGKPVLIAGISDRKKLVLGLPGHPLACMVAARMVLLPLLERLLGYTLTNSQSFFPVAVHTDLVGRTGIEEFYPAKIYKGGVLPLPAKSGYIGILKEADGLIRLDENTETVRQGERVDFMPW